MGQFYKHKELDVNEEKFNDYFNLNNLYGFEAIYIINDISLLSKKINGNQLSIIGSTDKETNKIMKKNFKNIVYIDSKISNYTSISYIKQSDTIYIKDNYNLINEYNLEDTISNFKGVIISNNIEVLKDLKLIDENIKQMNIKIDKYGIVSEI